MSDIKVGDLIQIRVAVEHGPGYQETKQWLTAEEMSGDYPVVRMSGRSLIVCHDIIIGWKPASLENVTAETQP